MRKRRIEKKNRKKELEKELERWRRLAENKQAECEMLRGAIRKEKKFAVMKEYGYERNMLALIGKTGVDRVRLCKKEIENTKNYQLKVKWEEDGFVLQREKAAEC